MVEIIVSKKIFAYRELKVSGEGGEMKEKIWQVLCGLYINGCCVT